MTKKAGYQTTGEPSDVIFQECMYYKFFIFRFRLTYDDINLEGKGVKTPCLTTGEPSDVIFQECMYYKLFDFQIPFDV